MPGNLEEVFDDERSCQQIGQHRPGIGDHRQDGDGEGVLERGWPISPRPLARAVVMNSACRVASIPSRMQTGDAPGEIKAEGERRQNGLPGRAPQGDGEPAQFDGQEHDQDRANDQARHADDEQGRQAARIIPPSPPVDRREKAQRNPRADGEAKRRRAERQRNRQPLPR